jgi:hypothetical protein
MFVVAGYRHVLRHQQPAFLGGTQHTESGDVGPGEDRGRRAGPIEGLLGGLVAALLRQPGLDDVRLQAVAAHRLFVPLAPGRVG